MNQKREGYWEIIVLKFQLQLKARGKAKVGDEVLSLFNYRKPRSLFTNYLR